MNLKFWLLGIFEIFEIFEKTLVPIIKELLCDYYICMCQFHSSGMAWQKPMRTPKKIKIPLPIPTPMAMPAFIKYFVDHFHFFFLLVPFCLRNRYRIWNLRKNLVIFVKELQCSWHTFIFSKLILSTGRISRAGSCAIDFQTKSVLALNEKRNVNWKFRFFI